ncbi:hypothetical protein QBC34DRAFT_456898 [Podospora aff. communis PSN243]|uniref:F-box domain-containing protein n=1 Tax=Podospora aff. communis PSN243 TaxID=3040156 RepID=A0AAV9FYR4_9PEZI|nr:hypothetical protein QBC34DRAFT_456898 [Podospora aff. communis PSN243]
MSLQQSCLLTVPREIRDHIYHEYLFNENGYLPCLKPIDLALTYTCRQIADEMRGLALRLNTVIFTTLYSDELRTRAGRWNILLAGTLTRGRGKDVVGEAALRMDDATANEVRRQLDGNPFASIFDRLRDPSQDDIYLSASQIAITDPLVHDYFAHVHWQRDCSALGRPVARSKYDPSFIFNFDREPWRIPTEEELDRIAGELPHLVDQSYLFVDQGLQKTQDYWKSHWAKSRFSAAAAAIHFLNSLSPANRKHLRKIVVGPIDPLQEAYGTTGFDFYELTRSVAEWMSEASAPSIPKAISLFLDAGPIPERAAEIFQDVVHRDLGWRLAYDRVCVPGIATPSDVLHKKTVRFYHQTIFPDLIRALCAKDPCSRVRCNFDPGVMWDEAQIAELAERGRHFPWDMRSTSDLSWDAHLLDVWEAHEGYDTVPPLPSVRKLIEETLVRSDQQ